MNGTYSNANSDLYIEKESQRFLNELRLNTILKELSPEQRKEYYDLINNGLDNEAKEFIKTNIPDLEDKLLKRIKETLLKENS